MAASRLTSRTNRLKSPAPSERGTEGLEALLTELACVLLRRGMTAREFGQLSRYAFARAAAATSRLKSGKINYSRVAAQTGLSRAEAKRLLSRRRDSRQSFQTPLERVLRGWRTDRHFTDPRGGPRRLSVQGHRASFAHLVRTHAGDIPPRAVLEELRRVGAVLADDKHVRFNASKSLRALHDFRFLARSLPSLIEEIRVASRRNYR